MISPTKSLPKILLLLLCIAPFILVPLKIAGFGYMPPDDALRHVGFVKAHKVWDDILVIRDAFPRGMDSHPGWHQILKAIDKVLDLTPGDLVVLSFSITFITFSLSGLVASKTPMAWLLAACVAFCIDPGFIFRLMLGRPFAISEAALVVILFLWMRSDPTSPRIRIPVILTCLTLAFWIHPTAWYVWGVPIAGLLLCRRWRYAIEFCCVSLLALCLASLLCGSWFNIWIYPLQIVWVALGEDPLVGTNLVSEFQPSGGPIIPLLVAALILLWKGLKGQSIRDEIFQLDFVVFILCWIFGLKVLRFNADWATPAFTVWLCRQISGFSWEKLRSDAEWILVASAAALTIYLDCTADLGGRYSNNLKSALLNRPVEEFQSMLPSKGGILYTTDMSVFYKLFYRLPHADFRYIIGFEPGIMPAEDLKVLRAIQFNDGILQAYAPWLEKMKPADRVILYYPRKPEWPGMEFSQFYSAWVGRKISAEDAKKKDSAPVAPAKSAQNRRPARREAGAVNSYSDRAMNTLS